MQGGQVDQSSEEETLAVVEIKFYLSTQTARNELASYSVLKFQLFQGAIFIGMGILTKTSYAVFDVSSVEKLMLRNQSMKNLTEVTCIPVCVEHRYIHLAFRYFCS